jgi:hypothetical protein
MNDHQYVIPRKNKSNKNQYGKQLLPNQHVTEEQDYVVPNDHCTSYGKNDKQVSLQKPCTNMQVQDR